MNTTFSELVDCLHQATRPEEVFGVLDGAQEVALKRRYRELAAMVHPDHNPGQAVEASRAFQALQVWYTQARQRLEQSTYGQHTYITAATALHDYVGTTPPLHGDLCDLFPCQVGSGPVLLKVARSGSNNDLLQAEAQVLHRIERELAGQRVRAHFPTLIEHFRLRDTEGRKHHVNVLRAEAGYVSLEEVLRAYPNGIDAADAAWMFNRILTAIGVLHNLGIIHGAVLPGHILIRPDDHNGMLIDWCYSVPLGETIKAVSPPSVAEYPPEVSARRPATAATDTYMAAACMVRLLGGNPATATLPPRVPKAIGALLRACLLPSPSRRSGDAWQIFEDFQEILAGLYGPRKFRPFVIPGRTPVAH